MADITINIYGGNNQIVPKATEATQIIIGELPEEQKPQEKTSESKTSGKEYPLNKYVTEESLQVYFGKIAECTSSADFAGVAVEMCRKEPGLTNNDVVKERFISYLLQYAAKLKVGRSISNLRARINDALANQTKRKF